MSALEDQFFWQLKVAGLPLPDREVTGLIPGRRFRFDFAWISVRLIVEIQGGTWNAGKHGRGAGIAADAEKLAEAQLAGWTIFAVTSDQVQNGKGVRWVQRFFNQQQQKAPAATGAHCA